MCGDFLGTIGDSLHTFYFNRFYMLYYSVLKDIIRQPRSNKDLMDSILQKAASIVREYGIDYVMEHNEDHYFDYDNNEIIKLSLEPIIDKTVTNVRRTSYSEYILYNYTQNTYAMVVTVELPKTDQCSYITKDEVDLSELTNKQLVELNKQLVDCSETVRRDKAFLESMKKYIHKGEFFVCGRNKYYEIYFVVGEPYIDGVGKISANMVNINIYYTSDKAVSIHEYDVRKKTFSIDSDDEYNHLSFEGAVTYCFNKCSESDGSLKSGYHSGVINNANKEICKVKEKIEQLNKDLVNTTDKKESLKIQLAIVEQEDKIENLRKKIAKNENAKANHFTRVAKVVGDIENKLNELIDNKKYVIE